MSKATFIHFDPLNKDLLGHPLVIAEHTVIHPVRKGTILDIQGTLAKLSKEKDIPASELMFSEDWKRKMNILKD